LQPYIKQWASFVQNPFQITGSRDGSRTETIAQTVAIIMKHIKVNDKQFCVVKNNHLLPPHKSGKKLHKQGNYTNKYSNCVPTSCNDYEVLPHISSS
jgi:protein tyrosine phosphatase